MRAKTLLSLKINDEYLAKQNNEHKPRYFAMLNCAVLLSGTKYEGGTAAESLAYYQYLLNLELPGLPQTFKIPEKFESKVKSGIGDLISLESKLSTAFKAKTINSKAFMDEFIGSIDQIANRKGGCYLPSGWANRGGGHFAGLKLRKLKNGHYAFSLINHGGGIKYHHLISKSGMKKKHSYQSEEYEVDLNDPNGRELLQKIIEMNYDIERQAISRKTYAIKEYDADDLYGLLEIYGKKLPTIENINEKSVTPQRTGTCSVTNVHALARDILMDNGATFKDKKRYHFIIKLRSIIAAYYFCRYMSYDVDFFGKDQFSHWHPESTSLNHSDPNYQLLSWALREFGVRLNKHKDILTDEEFNYCSELHHHIKEVLSSEKKRDTERSLPSLKGDLELSEKYDVNTFLPSVKDEKKSAKEEKTAKEEKVKEHMPVTTPTPKKLLSYFENTVSAHSRTSNENYQFLRRLPPCSGKDKDPYWDKVPKEDIDKIILQINNIINSLKGVVAPSPEHQSRQFALALMAYDIAAQLAPHSESLRLGSDYTFGLDDIYSDQLFFTDPEAYQITKRVILNFERRAMQKKRVITNAISKGDNQYHKTIHYVIRVLLDESKRQVVLHSLGKKTASDKKLFEHLMENLDLEDAEQKKVLSETVRHIIAISATAHNLGSHAVQYKRDNKFPSELKFGNSRFNQASDKKEAFTSGARGERSEIIKNIPHVEQKGSVHQDFSENAVFFQQERLLKQRKDPRNRHIKQPFQLQLSGSLSTESKVWECEEKDQARFEALNEDLRRIECTPNLQVIRALAWAKNNPGKLEAGIVRRRIHELLFQYGKLETAFATNFEATLNMMKYFLEDSFRYAQGEGRGNAALLVWLAEVSENLQRYTTLAIQHHPAINKVEAWPNHIDVLLERIKHSNNAQERSVLANYVVRSYHNKEALTQQDYCLLLTCRIIATLGEGATLSDEVWNKIKMSLPALFKQEKTISMLQTYLQEYLPSYLPKQAWTYHENSLIGSQGQFSIDLLDGYLKSKDSGKAKDRTEQTINDNKALFQSLNLTSKDIKLLYGENSGQEKTLRSKDGRWSFSYETGEQDEAGNTPFNITSVYQQMTILGKQYKCKLYQDDYHFFQPFESKNTFKTFYQYWQPIGNEEYYFVHQKNSDFLYLYSNKDRKVIQFKQTETGEWQPTDKQLLFLHTGSNSTDFERSWYYSLQDLFNTKDLRVTAAIDCDNATTQIEMIESLTLNLSFTANESGQLMSREMQGHYLDVTSNLPQLTGIANLIVLQHQKNKNNTKILLPTFALKKGEDNNALNNKEIIDYDNLCDSSQPYYQYSFDRQKNQLVSDSAEGNLYLAIVYRSLGDFKKAMAYLKHAKSYKNIDPKIFSIAKQILTRKIKSPQGAAFDLKINCYLREHQNKWSKEGEFVKFPDDWKKWIESQHAFYNQSFSRYKTDVSIFPSYSRLTPYELSLLGFFNASEEKGSLNERLDKITNLALLEMSNYKFESWCEEIIKLPNHWGFSMDGIAPFSSLRLYAKGQNKKPAFHYLVRYFGGLLMLAISKDKQHLEQLKHKLFSLLQNDADPNEKMYEIISILIFVSKHPDLFRHLKENKGSTESLLSVGKIIFENREKFPEEKNYLYLAKRTYNIPTEEKSRPSDFFEQKVKFSIATPKYVEGFKHPLASIADKYFSSKEKPLAGREFQLSAAGLGESNLLEKRLLERLSKGHAENLKKHKTSYHTKAGFTLENLKKDVLAKAAQDRSTVSQLSAQLIQTANKTPLEDKLSESKRAEAHNVILAGSTEQRPPITLELLFTAFLQQKPELLTHSNPFLTEQAIAQLFATLSDVAFLHSRISQAQEVLGLIGNQKEFKALEPYQLQKIAASLNKTRVYDYQQYPEFLCYEYATKRLLRTQQADILIKIITLLESKASDETAIQHALLQFAAGGGKTSVLIPILAQRFARKSMLPVIFNTNELYKIGIQEIPKSLRASFEQNLEVIERDLNHVWTFKELYKLLDDLRRWKKEGKCLLLKSVTWHSINIAMKLSYIHGNKKLTTAAQYVLDFFKNETVKLEDECHIVSDPLKKCIKTYGAMQQVPDSQLQLVSRFYDYLLGYESSETQIATLAGIKAGRTRPIAKAELRELQAHLARVIIQETHFSKIKNKKDKEELEQYLHSDSRKKPLYLKQLHKSDPGAANLIVLARAFIKTHLPHILTLQYGKDYGYSIHEHDLTAAPKADGVDVTSHHADQILVASLTVQLYNQRGLLPKHAEQILDALLQNHKEEREWNTDETKPTQAERLLLQYIPAEYKITCYDDIAQNPEIKAELVKDERLRKNPAVISQFLTEFALPQIGSPIFRQTSTAAELQAGFKRSLLLTATPGLPEVYPGFLKPESCFLEESFEALVIDTLLQEKNTGLCVLKKSQNPKAFFAQIPDDFISKMSTLIDRGALLTDFNIDEVMNTYLKLKRNQKTLKTVAFFKGEHLRLRSEEKNVKNMKIDGTALAQALASQNIKPEKFLLFLFLSLSKTTGTDIKRPYKDHAALTLGKRQTVTQTIQAAMRERQLLDDNAQSISWIMFEALYRKIHPQSKSGQFDPRHVFYWMIKNEAKAIQSKLINRAYQGIHQAVSEFIWQTIRSQSGSHEEKKSKNLDALKKFLEEKLDLSPYSIYEQEATQESTTKVLRAYLQSLLKSIALNEGALPKHLKQRINKIIEQTSALLPTLESPPKTQLSNEVQQNQQAKQKQQQQQKQKQQQRIKTNLDSVTDFKLEVEQYDISTDNIVDIFDATKRKKTKRYQPLRLAGCDELKAPQLLINERHFAVTQKSGDAKASTTITQLKPITMLLLHIKPDNSLQYLACTGAGAEFYSFLLNSHPSTDRNQRFALINTQGDILHVSNNTNIAECSKLTKNTDCQKMLIYTHFLNGKISDPFILSEIIKEHKWTEEGYTNIVSAICAAHVSVKPVQLLDHSLLRVLCGWDKPRPASSSKPTPGYQYRQEAKLASLPTIPLQPIKLEGATSLLQATMPQTALDGFLVGKKLMPIAKDNDQVQLENLANDILLPSQPLSEVRQKALMGLKQSIRGLLKSSLSPRMRIHSVEKSKEDFKRFDALLMNINEQLGHLSHTDKSLKKQAQDAVNLAYLNFSAGQTISACTLGLQRYLNMLSSSSKKVAQSSPEAKPALSLLFTKPSSYKKVFEGILETLAQSPLLPKEEKSSLNVRPPL